MGNDTETGNAGGPSGGPWGNHLLLIKQGGPSNQPAFVGGSGAMGPDLMTTSTVPTTRRDPEQILCDYFAMFCADDNPPSHWLPAVQVAIRWLEDEGWAIRPSTS